MVAAARSLALLLFLTLLAPGVSRPQEGGQQEEQLVRATARVDSNHILIGDWLRLSLQVDHRASALVSLPALPDSFEGFQVIRRDSAVQERSGDQVRILQSYLITAFDSGMHVIPPFPVGYTLRGDTALRLTRTSPIPIVVRGVAVDTSKAIKDIKPPLSVPITLADLLPYLVGLVLLAGAVWLIVYIRRKMKRGEPILGEEPRRPPREVALERLRSLESERYWQRGKVKEYHSILTDILRLYIEDRFSVTAMEMTTDETLEAAPVAALAPDVKDPLGEILRRADLVKFAKFQPAPDEHEKSLALAYSFVEATWRTAEEAAPAALAAQQQPVEVSA